jgi:hypothetical protein
MAPIPAVCDSCGRVFVATNLIGGTGSVQLENVGVGPCPYCGGMGKVPDGLYEFAGDAVRILRSRTADELDAIRSIVERVRAGELDTEAAGAEIDRVAPGAGALSALLSGRSQTLAAWLAVLIALLAWLAPRASRRPSPPMSHIDVTVDVGPGPVDDAQVRRVVEQVLSEQLAQVIASPSSVTPEKRQPTRANKTGRNAPCPCGSGRKFKHCHAR